MTYINVASLGFFGLSLILSPSIVYADDTSKAIIVKEKKRTLSDKHGSKTYEISTNADAYNLDLKDVIVKIPSITIDKNGLIVLQGHHGVKILVNNKEISTGFEAKNYPASTIDSIEVINPSANFKHYGTGGAVNIILKKSNAEGLNGIINIRGDGDGRYDIDFTSSYQVGRTNFNLTMFSNNSIKKMESLETQNYSQTSSNNIETTGKKTSRQQFINLGIEYQINDNNNLMFKIGGNNVHGANKEFNNTYITDSNNAVTGDYDYSYLNSFINKGQNLELNFQHNNNEKLANFDLGFIANQSDTDEENSYNFSFLQPVESIAEYDLIVKTKDNNMKLNGNYRRDFASDKQLSAGFEFYNSKSDIYQNTSNLTAIRSDVVDYNSTFKYKHDVGRLYINYQMPLGAWDISSGLRYEVSRIKTISTYSAQEQEYYRLLPSLDISREINNKIRFVSSYSHRTELPEIWKLNPTIIYSSPINQYMGNQSLKIQDTDYFSTGLVYRNDDINMGFNVFYRKNYKPVTASYSTLAGGIQSFSYINASNSSQTGIDLSFGWQMNDRLSYNITLNGYDGQIMGVINNNIITRDYQSYIGNLVIEYEPTSKDWVQLILDARGKNAILQGYETGYTKLDLTYRHKFTKKLTLSVKAYDILDSSEQRTIINLTGFSSETVVNVKRPAVSLGIAYKY